MLWWGLGALGLVVLLAQAYVRLAPGNPLDWHVAPKVTEDKDLANGVRRVLAVWPDAYGKLDQIVMATPRTTRLAGSPKVGLTTYVTRSLFWGFPDYTTIARGEGHVEIYARSRFGRSDMGVNKRRVEGWLAALRGD
ncbi:DUF1499 domain-containing protein [Pseudooceanicola sp.]|uniref:DUF1499 domain-containing protein n=1 Tax=Pseudooceanicola sp. TaxID=1914328 RepID=UPI00262B1CF6|nr:DUF1499 domain-containing protein [Pseudooceanicola sp.]MDF1854154.1 DUF1499 domain-containing protein [Pseudooceanicola sp.]